MEGKNMGKCFVCGKATNMGITKGEKFFCCAEHAKQFEDPKKPDQNKEICEFC